MSTNKLAALSCSVETVENPIKICVAATPAEKEEIYCFRYQIYVEEMSKNLPETDYENKLLYDDMDDWSILLYAKVGSEIIATKRINIGTINDFHKKVSDFLSLETFNTTHDRQKVAFITKVMVAPAYRSSSVLYLLLAKCYDICCHNHVQFIFGISHFHLLRLYEQLGCRRYHKNFFLPHNGLAVPIVLLTDDVDYLRKVHSPLYRIARKRKSLNDGAVNWFNTTFSDNLAINSQLITEEELWSMLSRSLQCLPTEAITLLDGLSINEAKVFLHNCSVYVQCNPGDIITFQGDISYSCNLLISGKLKSLTFFRPQIEYSTPGQAFGANGLTEHTKHREEIAAVSSSEILVLSGVSFQKFTRTHPEVAHKIIKNMIKLTRKPLTLK